MNNELRLQNILRELDYEIAPLEEKRAAFEKARLKCDDFSTKNYYSGIESSCESSISLLQKAKEIVRKHFRS